MNIAAIVPAAGKSKRMGKNKYLLRLGSRTIIEHCIAHLVEAHIDNTYVVLNKENKQLKEYIKQYKPHIVVNHLEDSFMADSIRFALNEITISNNIPIGILITPADMPLIKSDTIKNITATFSKNHDNIVIPIYNGKKGHPTIFPYSIIKTLNTKETLLDVIDEYKNHLLLYPIDDIGVILDIDTEEDFGQIKNIYDETCKL